LLIPWAPSYHARNAACEVSPFAFNTASQQKGRTRKEEGRQLGIH
jgi:hypothetical protein